MKKIIVNRLLILFFVFFARYGLANCGNEKNLEADWVFFDLGDTLIDTKPRDGKQKYMPGAVDYLKKLKANGHCLGLISNIPVSWGKNYSQRLNKLKDYVRSNWEPNEVKFRWDDYSVIFLPSDESEYKPNSSMFLKAFKYAKERSATNIYFQGEKPSEVNVARSLGFISHEIKIVDGMTNYLLVTGIE